ncbi:mRNA decay activator protein ZFP36-like [Pristis pectinata]|uniref:mRNA decay activator protein ZFP36-like n=1 Tax=Pristis pectinata TaxID=685728 RepID=UPI00223D95A1|nr:mRNA decay activator protein ZFP36-like [Pristis pectinata]
MACLRELCELVSELSFLDPKDFAAWKPGPEPRTVGPPAGFRRHSTSQLPPGGSRARLADSYWPLQPRDTDRPSGLWPGLGPGPKPSLGRCTSHGEWAEEPRVALPPPPPSPRYKTELCRPFQENSFCRYGDKCQFAHGLAELRALSRHPKYKTEPCRTFHSTGFCPYGSRCHFIHNPEEERGPRPRLRQSASFSGPLGPSASGPADLDWATLRAAFSPDLEVELARTLGLNCCSCRQHRRRQQQQPAPGLPLAGRSPSADSLSDQEDSGSSGSESPVFEQARRLPIFSRISVSE